MCAKPLAAAGRQALGAQVPAHRWHLGMSVQVASSSTQNERVHWQAIPANLPFESAVAITPCLERHAWQGVFPSPSHRSLKQQGRSPAKFNGEAFVNLSGRHAWSQTVESQVCL